MLLCSLVCCAAVITAPPAEDDVPAVPVLHHTADLRIGEMQEFQLGNGQTVTLKLLHVEELRDALDRAFRLAKVRLLVNGQEVLLESGNYRLPVTVAGVQVDCPITKGLYQDYEPGQDHWGLDADVRIRVWPKGSPWVAPGTFVYPARQKWFASATQMANEPSFVDGGDDPNDKRIYYHYGLDIGGCEGLVEIVAATDGVVVSAGVEQLPGTQGTPVATRYDVVYIRDGRNWYYRYSHLKSFEVKLGQRVKAGERIGLLGKEGGSGGWSHLHFDANSLQPSGRWGIEEGYAFLWEAYHRAFAPQVIAVARPHFLVPAGGTIVLDGTRSWSSSGKLESYDWTFTDGSTATGPSVKRTYPEPGQYSEILKVVDAHGNISHDVATVQVLDPHALHRLPPTIHACYSPTFDIHPGDPVLFEVRTFRTDPIGETWDFGDGSPRVTVMSDANADAHAPNGYAETTHAFARPGTYIVKVEHTSKAGHTATTHVIVEVEASARAGAGPAATRSPNAGTDTSNPAGLGPQAVTFTSGEERVDIAICGKPVTQYRYDRAFPKPILYPIQTPSGILVSRGFPLEPREGESTDHPFHAGLFFASDAVGGTNFWKNAGTKPQIAHRSVMANAPGLRPDELRATAEWVDAEGKAILAESRRMRFALEDATFVLDLAFDLQSLDAPVTFEDTEEALLAIRVAEWLREDGGPEGAAPAGAPSRAQYTSSEGQVGAGNVWGRRAKWVCLQGESTQGKAGIAIMHHPKSVQFPTWWHARAYGLFSANPFGQAAFMAVRDPERARPLNFTLQPGETARFGFRILVYDGHKSPAELESAFERFAAQAD